MKADTPEYKDGFSGFYLLCSIIMTSSRSVSTHFTRVLLVSPVTMSNTSDCSCLQHITQWPHWTCLLASLQQMAHRIINIFPFASNFSRLTAYKMAIYDFKYSILFLPWRQGPLSSLNFVHEDKSQTLHYKARLLLRQNKIP